MRLTKPIIKISNSSTNALTFLTKASTIWLQKLFPAPPCLLARKQRNRGQQSEKGLTRNQQEPNSWFINHHKLILKLIWKKLSFQKHRKDATGTGSFQPQPLAAGHRDPCNSIFMVAWAAWHAESWGLMRTMGAEIKWLQCLKSWLEVIWLKFLNGLTFLVSFCRGMHGFEAFLDSTTIYWAGCRMAGLHRVWSTDGHHQHHLGAC